MQKKWLTIDNKKINQRTEKDLTKTKHIKFSKNVGLIRDIFNNQVIVVINTKRMTYLKQADHNAPNAD